MLIHNFDPVLIDLKFLEIRWYSVAYILGILIGWIYARNIINKNYLLMNNASYISVRNFDNLIIHLILGIIVGGRLGYVIFYNLDFYINNLFEIVMVWKGGMSFHGGLIGVAIACIIYGKKNNIIILSISDVIGCVAPIGIFFGRIANFINGELYGKISNVPWAVIFPSAGINGRHPSQIYEALLEGLILFLIINHFAFKKNKITEIGSISALFLIYYSIFRIVGEIFREPDTHLGYFFGVLSMGSILSIFTFLIGMVLIYSIRNK